jgi:hypothetical protein
VVPTLSIRTTADCVLIHQTGTLDVQSYEEPPISGLEATHSTSFLLPGLRIFGREQVGPWDACEAIYGLKVSFTNAPGEPSTAIWATAESPAPGASFALPQA